MGFFVDSLFVTCVQAVHSSLPEAPFLALKASLYAGCGFIPNFGHALITLPSALTRLF